MYPDYIYLAGKYIQPENETNIFLKSHQRVWVYFCFNSRRLPAFSLSSIFTHLITFKFIYIPKSFEMLWSLSYCVIVHRILKWRVVQKHPQKVFGKINRSSYGYEIFSCNFGVTFSHEKCKFHWLHHGIIMRVLLKTYQFHGICFLLYWQ